MSRIYGEDNGETIATWAPVTASLSGEVMLAVSGMIKSNGEAQEHASLSLSTDAAQSLIDQLSTAIRQANDLKLTNIQR